MFVMVNSGGVMLTDLSAIEAASSAKAKEAKANEAASKTKIFFIILLLTASGFFMGWTVYVNIIP